MKPYFHLAAAALTFVAAPAWAHGDHEGAHGLVHVLSSPAHLGLLLLGGLAAVLLGKRLLSIVRRIWTWIRKEAA